MSIEETLRKSREVEERYKKFLKEKEESDHQWKQTEARIDNTLNKLSETKDSIKKIDEMYENFQNSYQKLMDDALEKLAASKMIEKGDPDFVPHMATPQQVAKLIKQKKKVMILTGAGISSASGIPTFRDKDGYWTKKKEQKVSPEHFLTLYNFTEDPMAIWDWIDDFYNTKTKCKANLGHACLDALCTKIADTGNQVCIVSQNIDNFHIQAQSPPLFEESKTKYPIFEIHGNVLKVRCDECSAKQQQMVFYPYTDFRSIILEKRMSPTCPKCQGRLRPHIMFFDEFYAQKFNKSTSVQNFLADTDLMMIVGTALQTGLSRKIVEEGLAKGIDMVQVNTQCIIRHKNTIWFEGKSDEFFVKLCNESY